MCSREFEPDQDSLTMFPLWQGNVWVGPMWHLCKIPSVNAKTATITNVTSCVPVQRPGVNFIFACPVCIQLVVPQSPSTEVHTMNSLWVRQGFSDHHHPHGPRCSACFDPAGGGRGPGLRSLLPLPPVLLPAGDGGALRPDRGGPLRLHLNLHLPGGADHLRGWGGRPVHLLYLLHTHTLLLIFLNHASAKWDGLGACWSHHCFTQVT